MSEVKAPQISPEAYKRLHQEAWAEEDKECCGCCRVISSKNVYYYAISAVEMAVKYYCESCAYYMKPHVIEISRSTKAAAMLPIED